MFPISSPAQIAASLTEHGSPRVVAALDGSYIKVAKVRGSLAWHRHAQGDALFMVLKGHLRIEMETGVAELAEGEMFVVPQGVRHHPVAEEECQILLIEPKSTRHTGDVVTQQTPSLVDPLWPV
jgi:quercetin dioxygenase-like cupin family protein